MTWPRLLAPLRALGFGGDARRVAAGEADIADAQDREILPEQLDALITRCCERAQLRAPAAEMLRRVLYLAETTAGEVMTPRTEVIGIREHTPLDEAAALILEHGHSRYPVYRDAMDHVIGVVLGHDVWRAQVDGAAPPLAALMRDAFYVPDSKPLDDLLREMQAEQTHMAVVIDEFGGTAGIVTIEDIIEEIVGEIADELDEAPIEYEPGAGGAVIFPGGVAIDELNARYGLDLPDTDFTTVGGFVLGRLGRIAQAGDAVVIEGGTLRVLAVRKRRIERLAFEPRTSAA